jgi:CHAT domain-containing protein
VLAEQFTLARLPAAGVLPELRAPESVQRATGAAVVLAPFPDRLRATGTEADALARIVPNAPVHRGAAATEDRLRRALGERVPVHVATHAAFNSANPMFSGLALAVGRGGSRDDGRLDVHEVLEMLVRSPLVFLSGCETAVGAARATAFDRMEDVTTLGDAFLLSGAGGVIATLWRIDDEGAAYFAETFYRQLANRSAAEALAEAQRAMIRHPRWGDPYYWAAYTLSGDASSAGLP